MWAIHEPAHGWLERRTNEKQMAELLELARSRGIDSVANLVLANDAYYRDGERLRVAASFGGKGLFTNVDIAEGSPILIYGRSDPRCRHGQSKCTNSSYCVNSGPRTHTDGRRDLAGRANDPLGTQHGANMEIVLVELEDGVTVPFYLALRDILSGEELLWSYGTAYWSRKRQRWGSLRRAACDCRLSVSRALAPPLPTRAASGSDPAKSRVSRAMGSTDAGGKQDEVRAGDVRAPPLTSSS